MFESEKLLVQTQKTLASLSKWSTLNVLSMLEASYRTHPCTSKDKLSIVKVLFTGGLFILILARK